jgi:hypothetical protein
MRFGSRPGVMGILGCLGVVSASCAQVSGLDRLTQVECVDPCGSAENALDAAQIDTATADGGGDGREAGTVEAMPDSLPAQGDGAPESMADSTAHDSGTGPESGANDAARDAPVGVDVGTGAPPPATFCSKLSPSPLFCEDFDEGSYASGWSSVHTMLGSLGLDTTEYTSPPGAMIAQSGATAQPAMADVAGYRSFALTGQNFIGAIELDLRVDRADLARAFAVLAQIKLLDGSGTGEYVLQLVTTSNGAAPLTASFNEIYFGPGSTGQPVVHSASQTIALATWTHIKLSAAISATGGSSLAALSFNGRQVAASSIGVPVKNFSPSIGAGILWASNPSSGWTAVYDNVTFDAKVN